MAPKIMLKEQFDKLDYINKQQQRLLKEYSDAAKSIAIEKEHGFYYRCSKTDAEYDLYVLVKIQGAKTKIVADGKMKRINSYLNIRDHFDLTIYHNEI